MEMKEILFDILACPDCKTRVQYNSELKKYDCSECGKIFSVSGDIPLLFSKHSHLIEDSGAEFYENRNIPEKASTIKKAVRTVSKLSSVSVGETLHDILKNKYIVNAPRDSLVLNLGSGIDNIIMRDNVINFDIFPHPNTDISGDGHYLPFLTDSLDGVWVCAVLEHLENPFRVASEIYRVLKPGGFVLVGAPFMFHLHGSPHDYFRYTDNGLRSVFRKFREIECGRTHTLPTGTLIELISQYFSLFAERKVFAAALRLSVKLLLCPLKFVDLYLKRKERADMLAGGFVFLGMKDDTER